MPKQVQTVMERVVTRRVTLAEYEQLRQTAKAQGLTVSDITRKALEVYFEKLSQSRSDAA